MFKKFSNLIEDVVQQNKPNIYGLPDNENIFDLIKKKKNNKSNLIRGVSYPEVMTTGINEDFKLNDIVHAEVNLVTVGNRINNKICKFKIIGIDKTDNGDTMYTGKMISDDKLNGKIKYFLNKDVINENIKIPVDIGDTILFGKFKNRKGIVKEIYWNEKEDLIATLDNGKEIQLLKFRLNKK